MKENDLCTCCTPEEAFIHLSLKVLLILQFIHLSFHPCIEPSIHHRSIHLSTAALAHQHTHPQSHPVIQPTHYFLLRKQKHHLALLAKDLQSDVKLWQRRNRAGEWAEWQPEGRWRSEEEEQGGSKCQVPLGSEDGGYIYQSKQPRGAEYFTCRCRLLHYHIHQSHSVPSPPLSIQNSYNTQNGGCYKMLNWSGAQILKRK